MSTGPIDVDTVINDLELLRESGKTAHKDEIELWMHTTDDSQTTRDRRISFKYPRYRLLNAYDDEGNSLYLENLTSSELKSAVEAAAKVLGVRS